MHNPLLMERIAAHVDALSPVVRSSSCPVTTHEAAVGVCSDSKESMLFALLGYVSFLCFVFLLLFVVLHAQLSAAMLGHLALCELPGAVPCG